MWANRSGRSPTMSDHERFDERIPSPSKSNCRQLRNGQWSKMCPDECLKLIEKSINKSINQSILICLFFLPDGWMWGLSTATSSEALRDKIYYYCNIIIIVIIIVTKMSCYFFTTYLKRQCHKHFSVSWIKPTYRLLIMICSLKEFWK